MKRIILASLLILNFSFGFAQTEAGKFKTKQLNSKYYLIKEFKSRLISHDFSSLFTHTDNNLVYGFIGDNYQRIRIKFIKVTKDSSSSDTYHIYGKSMVKNNVDEFVGTIKISNIRIQRSPGYGVDNKYKNKGIKGQYFILGDYNFSENKNQPHSGKFTGVFQSEFYLDKDNKVHYNDIGLNADGYSNNQFVGEWIDYKSNLGKICNWGDFRVPNSADLDIGSDEFSPNEKYLKSSWQSVRDNDKKIENAEWWK